MNTSEINKSVENRDVQIRQINTKVIELNKQQAEAKSEKDADIISNQISQYQNRLEQLITEKNDLLTAASATGMENRSKNAKAGILNNAKSAATDKLKGVATNLVKGELRKYALIGGIAILLIVIIMGVFIYSTSNTTTGLLVFNQTICEKLGKTDCTEETIKEIGKKTANDIGLRVPTEEKI